MRHAPLSLAWRSQRGAAERASSLRLRVLCVCRAAPEHARGGWLLLQQAIDSISYNNAREVLRLAAEQLSGLLASAGRD